MSACVIDANIAVKWFLPSASEELFGEARDLLDRHKRGEVEFLVPDIFWAESGNIFWKAVRYGRCSKADAEGSLAVLKAGRLMTVSSIDLLETAFTIATACSRTFYDSLYVALAVESRTHLVTADEKLVNALGARFPVEWLGAL